MSTSNYRIRRATLDDLDQLVAMWQSMHLPAEDLAKRATEFQVAEGPDSKLLGALGLQIVQGQGLIHSEAFSDFALSDPLRSLLWERLQSVAANHGLLRLWTQEAAPFWNRCGLAKADGETLAKLPAVWSNSLWSNSSSAWLTLKLKDSLEEVISVDKEFKLFMESEKQRTQRAFQQARALKFVATAIAAIVFILVMIGAFVVVKNNALFLHR